MGASLVVAVRKAVVAAVDALAAFNDTEVLYAYQHTTSKEFAYTRAAEFDHSSAAMKAGRLFRNEDARFEFVIWVQLVGGTPVEAAERALVLGLALEEWVADNKNGVGGSRSLMVDGSGSLREAAGDQASFAELVYPIRYEARLT